MSDDELPEPQLERNVAENKRWIQNPTEFVKFVFRLVCPLAKANKHRGIDQTLKVGKRGRKFHLFPRKRISLFFCCISLSAEKVPILRNEKFFATQKRKSWKKVESVGPSQSRAMKKSFASWARPPLQSNGSQLHPVTNHVTTLNYPLKPLS